LQLLVKAAGGTVTASPVKEAGLLDPEGTPFSIALTSAGMQDPIFAGMETILRVFQLHGETVTLTGEMELLAEGAFCRNQVVRIAPKTYGIQCHFELTPGMFACWNKEDPDLLVLDAEEQSALFYSFIDTYTQTGKQLISNFLEIALNPQR
jgi:GMP synthase (glutamine-hydrolysing)